MAKRTNNDLQNPKQKTNEQTTRIPLTTGGELRRSGSISSSYSISATSSPPVFSEICVGQSSVFCVVFCRSVFIVLAIVLPVLRIAAFEYPLGIFKLFLDNIFVHFGGQVFKHTIGILMGAKMCSTTH